MRWPIRWIMGEINLRLLFIAVVYKIRSLVLIILEPQAVEVKYCLEVKSPPIKSVP